MMRKFSIALVLLLCVSVVACNSGGGGGGSNDTGGDTGFKPGAPPGLDTPPANGALPADLLPPQ